MGYYTGNMLKQKVVEYGLVDVDRRLANVANGTDTFWPVTGVVIPNEQEYMESTRIVIYSMLHSYGLKGRFTVKTNYQTFEICITQKTVIDRANLNTLGAQPHRRTGEPYVPPSTSGHANGQRASLKDIPAEPENLDGLWDENITLDTPVGAGVVVNSGNFATHPECPRPFAYGATEEDGKEVGTAWQAVEEEG